MAREGRGPPPHTGFIGRHLAGNFTSESRGRGGDEDDEVSTGTGEPVEHPGLKVVSSADEHLLVVRDLKKSGLEVEDIQARTLGTPEKAACGLPSRAYGYIIPYYDASGDPLTFYRSRILNADYATNGTKYRHPRKTPNHIYFPQSFRQVLVRWCRLHPGEKFLIITEGEKKAACASKFGFPCIGLGGVDNWRSRTVILPEDTEFYSTKALGGASAANRPGPIRARLPSSDSSVPELVTLAQGFGDMIDLITQFGLSPIIIYDSDRLGTLKAEVQRAATMLAYELVYLGIHSNRVKQVVLPPLREEEGREGEAVDQKTGLDDFIMSYGPDDLLQLIRKSLKDPTAFPRHPNPKGFISTQLQNKMSRKSMQQCASMILTELDASGMRLRSRETGDPFYYDRDTHILMPARMVDQRQRPLHETPFGTLLYQKYGISANDNRVLVWVAAQFTGEEPISEVSPKRVISLITEREDPLNSRGIALQISDSQYFAVSGDPEEAVKLCSNGEKGILFERGQVEPVDVELVLEYFEQQLSEATEARKLKNWWAEVLDDTNVGLAIDTSPRMDVPDERGLIDNRIRYVLTPQGKEMRQYASLLYYISPYLLRWRGTQLPVELMIGGPGSGKSSLYSLRLQIMVGRPRLRNIPSDIRDWYASLANSGGLHVTDNVNFMNRELRQRLSDELCRLATEPEPEIEKRKLYTDSETIRIPVHNVFAFTSIQPCFFNEDLIQRAVTLHTETVGREPKGSWVQEQLNERGGREAWIAHQMLFLHLFLRQPWRDRFRTQHRLINLEQCLVNASQVFQDFTLYEDRAQALKEERRSAPESQRDAKRDGRSVASTVAQEDFYPDDLDEPEKDIWGQPDEQDENGDAPSSPSPVPNLGSVLKHNQSQQLVETDWVLQGIQEYANSLKEQNPSQRRIKFHTNNICDWCMMQEKFEDNEVLVNPRKLGRYMHQRMVLLASALRIHYAGNKGNRTEYLLENPRPAKKNTDED